MRGAWSVATARMPSVTAGARALLLTLSLSLAACSRGEDGVAAGTTRTDSAGFTIATNTAAASALRPVLTVDSVSQLQIGVEEGAPELMFSDIAGVARLDDGRIAVVNRRPMEIRIFDPAGRFLTRLGAAGRGPGEFAWITRIFAGGGDTVMTVNMPYFQLLRFTVSGGHVGTLGIPRDSLAALLTDMRPAEGAAEYLRNGSIIIAADPSNRPRDDDLLPTGELFRRQTTTVWIGPDHRRTAVLGSFGGIQQMFIDIGGGRRAAELPPNARWPIHALGGRGARYCAAADDRPEVRCIDDDGSRLIVRWAQDSVATPPDLVERWRASLRADAARPGSPTSSQTVERIIAGMMIPSTLAPIDNVIVDTERRIFVRGPDLETAEGHARYRVFSAAGELLGSADLPRMQVLDIGDDYLLAVARNEDGVEFVVVHDVNRERS